MGEVAHSPRCAKKQVCKTICQQIYLTPIKDRLEAYNDIFSLPDEQLLQATLSMDGALPCSR
jgi:hypothetical protein